MEHSANAYHADIAEIEDNFPKLKGGSGYTVESPKTIAYNCLSWALGINWTRYDPSPRCAGYYWLPGIKREWSKETILQIFEKHGYTVCDNFELEEGYEKIAVYIEGDDFPGHFARQLENGKWASKLGSLNDIEHDSLDSIGVPDYGVPKIALRRPIKRGASNE